jgi:hypothetical protein
MGPEGPWEHLEAQFWSQERALSFSCGLLQVTGEEREGNPRDQGKGIVESVKSRRTVFYLLAAALLIVALWFAVFNNSPSRYRCDARPPPHPCDKDYDIPRRVAIVAGTATLALGMVWSARRFR